MRTVSTLLALSAVALIATACSRDDTTRASDSELKRDLDLATTSVALANPAAATANLEHLETAPTSAPEVAKKLLKSPTGRKSVKSKKPTVAAAPEPTMVAVTEEVTHQVAEAPTASEKPAENTPSSEGVALPRPSAIPVNLPGAGSDPITIPQDGRGAGRGGMGGGIGVIFGAVIRGGGAGDDHCELDGTHGGRRPVYAGNPGGIGAGRSGTWGRGSGTFPINPYSPPAPRRRH